MRRGIVFYTLVASTVVFVLSALDMQARQIEEEKTREINSYLTQLVESDEYVGLSVSIHYKGDVVLERGYGREY